MSKLVWLSIDPVNCKLDFYPGHISKRIEKLYNESINYLPAYCVLGSDFFNATVHFHQSGSFYQTTPTISLGRHGVKPPGYRSVIRYNILNSINNIVVYGKLINGECRVAEQDDYDFEFSETIPETSIIDSINFIENNITYWLPEDINSEINDKNVVIWQWCRSTNQQILLLPDEYWVPYLFEDNKNIEKSFKNNEPLLLKINNNEERIIEFTKDSCFGLQKSLDETKVRNIRRKIVNIQELKNKIININKIPCDKEFIENIVNFEDIPFEFICPISQDIMSDPVKTVDNFIYDRNSIAKWFSLSNKSPCTGLELSSKLLTSEIELKKLIDHFIKLKFDYYNEQQKVNNLTTQSELNNSLDSISIS